MKHTTSKIELDVNNLILYDSNSYHNHNSNQNIFYWFIISHYLNSLNK
jgi:hypothetical protein